MSNSSEMAQVLLDQVACGQLSRHRFLTAVSEAGLTAGLSGMMVEHAIAAGENQAINQTQLKGTYDYIVVGGGASGSIIAGELSKTGADVLIVESGGADTGPTIGNPSIWFYNVGGPLDWKLPAHWHSWTTPALMLRSSRSLLQRFMSETTRGRVPWRGAATNLPQP
jgi:choline dehydrogenase